MATMQKLIEARGEAENLTLADIRDGLPDSIDPVRTMMLVKKLDQQLFVGWSEEEIRAVYLGGLMVHLLPD